MKGLYEIITGKKWMITPDFIHGVRKALERNLNEREAFSKPEKMSGFVTAKTQDGYLYYPEEYQISEDGKKVKGAWALEYEDEQNFPFVSVLTIDGPITRNGGGCSYGSIDHRDMMIRAANNPLCCGHVFVINTPGGSAWAKNDYQQAIDYAHSKGQPVLAFIDGMCASAGMYLASFCDERYYMHPKNEIGCIGVMAAFYSEADGSKNQFTDETYHELYDPESFDKNKPFRDIANDGNDELLVKELAELGVEFREDVKKACPSATEEHLHGKIFNAEDVTGILVDAQSDFFSVVQRAFALHSGTAIPNKRKPAASSSSASSSASSVSAESNESASIENHNVKPNNINMANYPLINSALGIKEGELQVNEDGAFMNTPLLDVLEDTLNANEQKVADAQQKATDAEQSLADLQAKFDNLNSEFYAAKETQEVAEKALAEANEEHTKEIENINAQHSEAIAKKDEEIANLTSAKATADEQLKTAQESLATAQQTLADKDAQIAALTNEPEPEPEAGAAPVNNGEGAKVGKNLRTFDPSAYKTCTERKAAFERFKRGEE